MRVVDLGQIARRGAACALLAAGLSRAALACPDLPVAAALAEIQYDVLVATRALPVLDPSGPGVDGAEADIRAYLDFASGDGARPGGLVFYLNDAGSVCGYVLTSASREVRRFALPLGAGRLAELVEAVLAAVSRDAAPMERRARRRDGSAVVTSRAAAPLPDGDAPAERPDQLLRALSDALFPDWLAAEVEGLSHLTVVPAINIGLVPFAALDPDGDGRPLAATTSVNVEAALRYLLAGRLFGRHLPGIPHAIAGDPDARADPGWIFPRLPGAGREARRVAAIFDSSVLVGEEVTVAAVTERMRGAEYIHIAAHGYSDADNPVLGSFLALSDGRLTALDIQSMEFARNPLVVLSACQSGRGGALDAGIIGLARAFLLAGASSVVASLWNVDDAATEAIMVRFAELLPRHAPAEALRRAQDEARKRWPDPRIWAAFVLFGSDTVTFDRPSAAGAKGSMLEATFLVRRDGADEPQPIEPGARLAVAPGDEIHVAGYNRSNEAVTIEILYEDSTGTLLDLGNSRLEPGAPFNLGLAAFTDDTFGHERLIVVASRDPAAATFARAEPLAPLARARAIIGREVLGAFMPASGTALVPAFGFSARAFVPVAPGEGRPAVEVAVVPVEVRRTP